MGKSYTINVIGCGINENGRQPIYDAMNKTEMVQQKIKAERRGDKIVEWYAQTATGAKMIGAIQVWECVPDHRVKHAKLVKCPVCNGTGGNLNGPVKHGCVCCNASGMTQQGNWKKWQPWQIEMMKKEFSEA